MSSEFTTTLILILYLAGFAALHSLMASLPFKRRVRRILGEKIHPWYSIAFSAIAFMTILPLAYLVYLHPGRVLYVAPSPWRWVMVSGQVLFGLWFLRAFADAPHRFEVPLQLAGPKGQKAEPLSIRGVYCWVRDPFLLSGFFIIWLTPFMTTNLLALYIFVTVYLYLGSLHWEKRLIAQFGDAYRAYLTQVPRTIPWKGRCCPIPET